MPACLRCRTLVHTNVYYRMNSGALCRADWRLFSCACGTYGRCCFYGFRSLFVLCPRKKWRKFKNKSFVVVQSWWWYSYITLSKKSTPPAVMFTSRLALPSAMTWTEKSTTCAANLPRSQKHTRARFLLLLLWCCCIIAVGCGAAAILMLLLPSLVLSRHSLRKNDRKKTTKRKKMKHEFFVDTKRETKNVHT